MIQEISLSFPSAVYFTCLGDLHIDSTAFDEELFNEVITFIEKHRIHFIGSGDFIDYFFYKDMRSYNKQNVDVNETIDRFINFARPLVKKKLLHGLIEGNHDSRIAKMTAFNWLQHVCEHDLKIPYSSTAFLVNLQVKQKTWKIYILHGWGNGRTVASKVRRIEELAHQWEGVDVIFIAHSHHPFIVPVNKRTPEGYRPILGVSTPAFITDPDYIIEKGYPSTPFMFPYLRLTENEIEIYAKFFQQHKKQTGYDEMYPA